MKKYLIETAPLYFWRKGSTFSGPHAKDDAFEFALSRKDVALRIVEIDGNEKREIWRNELAHQSKTAKGGGVRPQGA